MVAYLEHLQISFQCYLQITVSLDVCTYVCMYVCMYVHIGGVCMLCINGKQAANVSEARKRQRRHN